MKEERKKDVRIMSSSIDQNSELDGIVKKKVDLPATSSAELLANKIKSTEDIMKVSRIDIPVCETLPCNGRIYVVEITGSETKTAAGIILPHKLSMKKNDEVKDACRYFVVAWDPDDIPESIQKRLKVGKEINPFLPTDIEEWDLPRVIDWNTGNVFKVVHYTELAGTSKIDPVEGEKK